MVEEDTAQNDQQTDQQEPTTVEVTSIEDVGTLVKKVSVEVTRDEINRRLDKNYGELAGTAQVPGFRIGKAPRRLIEKRFGKDVQEQVRLAVISAGIEQAIEQKDIKTIGEPDLDLDKIQMPDDGPLSFSFQVEVAPEFDLPNLDGIEVVERAAEVTEKDIDDQIENMRWRLAVLEDQGDDAKVEKGDHLHCDLRLEVAGQAPTTSSGVELIVRAHPIEGITFDGLEQALVGAAVGQTVETEATVPSEHANESWRDKQAKLAVTVGRISKWHPPELNEELARKMGFDTIEQWRDLTRTDLTSRKGQQIRQDMQDQVRKYLLDNTTFDLPEKLTDQQTERAIMHRIMQLRQMGMPQVLIEEKIDDVRTGARDLAIDDLRFTFIVAKIAHLQEIEVSDEEVNSVIAGMAASHGKRPERLRQEMVRDDSYQALFGAVRERKVLAKLLENAKVTNQSAEQADESSNEHE